MTAAATPPPATVSTPAPPGAPSTNQRFRIDVEGLRGLAMLMILVWHAGWTLFDGAFVSLDWFFVISGFVITTQLIGEMERKGRIHLIPFYARRAKRLLPAAGTVLVFSAAATWALLPKTLWENTGKDIIASSLYFVNWQLADREVDYLAEDVPPSVVQHFWSLSVEEQFYIGWPLILLVCGVVAVRLGLSRRLALTAGLVLVFVPSFAWSVHYTEVETAKAYFVSTTRLWEFALGGLVAIVVPWLNRTPRALAAALTWVGVALMMGSAYLVTEETHWPGSLALVPTIGVAMVIGFGEPAGRWGAILFLRWRLLVFIGTISYSMYLWHWPILTLWRERTGELPLPVGLALAAFTVVPAYLSYRLVENPLRRAAFTKSSPAALSTGLNFTLAGLAAGLALVLAVPSAGTATAAPEVDPQVLSGRLSQHPSPSTPVPDSVDGPITPDPLEAAKDVPDLYAEGCQQGTTDSEPITCTYGPEDAATTIAVVGDSKSAQWVPALQRLTETHDWRVVTYTKSACQFNTSTTSEGGQPYTSCHEWGQRVAEALTDPANGVDVVITSGQRKLGRPGTETTGDLTQDAVVEGLQEMWARLTAADLTTIVLADTPQTGGNVYECVAENPDDLRACAYDRDKGIRESGVPVQKRAVDASDGFDLSDGARPQAGDRLFWLDLNDWICPAAECTPVSGNTLIYRQGSHITKTFTEQMAPYFEEALENVGVRG